MPTFFYLQCITNGSGWLDGEYLKEHDEAWNTPLITQVSSAFRLGIRRDPATAAGGRLDLNWGRSWGIWSPDS